MKCELSHFRQPEDYDCMPVLVPGSDSLHLFTEGDDLYDAMLASISQARQDIRLESYIFADDEIGWRFAEVLAQRARAGVGVRIHLDAAGTLLRGGKRFERYLCRHGARVKWFHRWSWLDPLRYNRRHHRKLLVIDGTEVFLGGFNIHRESSRSIVGDKRWRDAHIRFGNDLAVQASEMFDSFWNGSIHWSPPKNGRFTSVLVPNHSSRCRYIQNCIFTSRFASAQQFIYMSTPYFVPDYRTQKALMEAAIHGVDVRVLVPGETNIPLTRWAAHALYPSLLQAGVRIYEYLPRLMHAKTVVVDGTWGTVGSSNFDYRSFFLNYELNLVTRDNILCRKLEEQFLEDLLQAEEVKFDRWVNRSWDAHLYESIGWIARRWL